MSQIQQIKDAHNIVDVIGSRVQLQRSGSNFKGLCPFHSEKSPSFFVSEEMQRYKCFGCGESGDIFTFLEKYEGMSFQEALETLAHDAGITLEKTMRSDDDRQRSELLEIMDLAREYYHWLLTKHEMGEPARAYLRERSVSATSIKLFQIGSATTRWDSLIKFLHTKKKYPLELLVRVGLVIRSKSGRHYDRFRSRVMFPLRNHRGQVVGFSGRIIPSLADDKDQGGKYINTPETMLYHKSELLYGYSELLQSIRKQASVLVVEGELDVISSAQAHVSNIVAIKGSALTAQHVRLLARTVDSIQLCLDADKAGIQATERAIEVLTETAPSRDKPLDLRVVRIPRGKDPDDFARSNPSGWRELTKRSISVFDFLIEVALEQHDSSTAAGKRAIMQFLAPWLSKVQHAVEIEHYVRTLSKALGVREASIEQDLRQQKEPKQRIREKVTSPEQLPLTRREQLERRLWFLLLHSSDHFEKRRTAVRQLEFKLPGTAQLLERLKTETKKSWQDVARSLPADQQEFLFELYSEQSVLQANFVVTPSEWQRTMSELQREIDREQIVSIASRLEELELKNELSEREESEQNELLRELVQLQRKQPTIDR